jgi:hypothetical protein
MGKEVHHTHITCPFPFPSPFPILHLPYQTGPAVVSRQRNAPFQLKVGEYIENDKMEARLNEAQSSYLANAEN